MKRRPIWWLILDEVRAGIGRVPEIHRNLVTGSRATRWQWFWLWLMGRGNLYWYLTALEDQGLVRRQLVRSSYEDALQLTFFHITDAGIQRLEKPL